MCFTGSQVRERPRGLHRAPERAYHSGLQPQPLNTQAQSQHRERLLTLPQVNHHLRHLSTTPLLHARRLRDNRAIVSPLLTSPSRPTRSDLVARSIVQPRTAAVSRRLARSLTCIRLSRRLAARPSAQVLVERAVLPRECVPGLAGVHVAPGLVARRRAVERERVRDGLRGFVGAWGEEVCRGRGRVS